jgi:hypothetical protein
MGMTSLSDARETIYIVLIGVFIIFSICGKDTFLMVFVVCVEKTRQIKCFVLQCCT